MATVFERYESEMMQFYSELDEHITEEAKKRKASSGDLDRAILGLWRMTTYSVFAIISDFSDKRKFYAVAGCTRLVLECAADAEYLCLHPSEAESYWKNQEKIKTELNVRKDKWQAFIDGTVNRYGKLEDKTFDRIKDTLGKEAIGQYNFLCFYSHPNTAGLFWLLADKTGNTIKYVLQIMTQKLGNIIELLDHKTCFEVESAVWTQRLDEIFKLLGGDQSTLKI